MRRELIIHNIEGNRPDIPYVQAMLSTWLNTIPSGTWSLKLKKIPQKRTLNQNAILWAWMTAVSKEWAEGTGEYYTKEQFKEFFARKYLPVTGPDGETIGKGTSTLTKEEMTEFLNNIHAWVAQNMNMNLPNAEDRMFNEWYGQYEED